MWGSDRTRGSQHPVLPGAAAGPGGDLGPWEICGTVQGIAGILIREGELPAAGGKRPGVLLDILRAQDTPRQRIIGPLCQRCRQREPELEDAGASPGMGPLGASPRDAGAKSKPRSLGLDQSRHSPPSGTKRPGRALPCPACRHRAPMPPGPAASHSGNVTGNSSCFPERQLHELGTVPSRLIPCSVSTQQLRNQGIITKPML